MRTSCLACCLMLFRPGQGQRAAGGPPTFCRAAVIDDEGNELWCATVSSCETFAGAECEPMSVAAVRIDRGGSMIPAGSCGVSAGDCRKAFDTVQLFVTRS